MRNKALFSTMTLLCVLTHGAHADSLRCGTRLVNMEDNKAEVIEKCGQPSFTDTFCRYDYLPGKLGYEAVCHQVDVWTYNFGPGTFLMNVRFEEGRIISITHGDRVK